MDASITATELKQSLGAVAPPIVIDVRRTVRWRPEAYR